MAASAVLHFNITVPGKQTAREFVLLHCTLSQYWTEYCRGLKYYQAALANPILVFFKQKTLDFEIYGLNLPGNSGDHRELPWSILSVKLFGSRQDCFSPRNCTGHLTK